jgi:hypothetical protein
MERISGLTGRATTRLKVVWEDAQCPCSEARSPSPAPPPSVPAGGTGRCEPQVPHRAARPGPNGKLPLGGASQGRTTDASRTLRPFSTFAMTCKRTHDYRRAGSGQGAAAADEGEGAAALGKGVAQTSRRSRKLSRGWC